MKAKLVIYWFATGTLSALMLYTAVMYFVKYEAIADVFTRLSFPTYIIYPLAIAKILGIAAILIKSSKTLKEWAYAGFFFDFVLALSAHLNAGDGIYFLPAFICLVLLGVSYFLDKQIFD